LVRRWNWEKIYEEQIPQASLRSAAESFNYDNLIPRRRRTPGSRWRPKFLAIFGLALFLRRSARSPAAASGECLEWETFFERLGLTRAY